MYSLADRKSQQKNHKNTETNYKINKEKMNPTKIITTNYKINKEKMYPTKIIKHRNKLQNQ